VLDNGGRPWEWHSATAEDVNGDEEGPMLTPAALVVLASPECHSTSEDSALKSSSISPELTGKPKRARVVQKSRAS
jgi:hypothetical protein